METVSSLGTVRVTPGKSVCMLLALLPWSDVPKETDTVALRQGSSKLPLCFGPLF